MVQTDDHGAKHTAMSYRPTFCVLRFAPSDSALRAILRHSRTIHDCGARPELVFRSPTRMTNRTDATDEHGTFHDSPVGKFHTSSRIAAQAADAMRQAWKA